MLETLIQKLKNLYTEHPILFCIIIPFGAIILIGLTVIKIMSEFYVSKSKTEVAEAKVKDSELQQQIAVNTALSNEAQKEAEEHIKKAEVAEKTVEQLEAEVQAIRNNPEMDLDWNKKL